MKPKLLPPRLRQPQQDALMVKIKTFDLGWLLLAHSQDSI